MSDKYLNDDFCDIYEKKICDNCGKCLEQDGVDIRAINIEDIAKTVDENQYLEEQLKEAKAMLTKENSESEEEFDFSTLNADDYLEEEYKDAFDEDIVYFDDIGINDENSLDDLTDELYPGIRKFKH